MINSIQHAYTIIKRLYGSRDTYTEVGSQRLYVAVPYTVWEKDGLRGAAMIYLNEIGKVIRINSSLGAYYKIYV